MAQLSDWCSISLQNSSGWHIAVPLPHIAKDKKACHMQAFWSLFFFFFFIGEERLVYHIYMLYCLWAKETLVVKLTMHNHFLSLSLDAQGSELRLTHNHWHQCPVVVTTLSNPSLPLTHTHNPPHSWFLPPLINRRTIVTWRALVIIF